MPTYPTSKGYSPGFVKGEDPFRDSNRYRLSYVDSVIDCAKAAETLADGFAAADVIQVTKLPVNTLVIAVGFEVITPEGGAANITIGYDAATAVAAADSPTGYALPAVAADADGFIGATTLNPVASAVKNVQSTFTHGALMDNDLNLTVTFSAAADTAVFRVWAVIVDCSGRPAPDYDG